MVTLPLFFRDPDEYWRRYAKAFGAEEVALVKEAIRTHQARVDAELRRVNAEREERRQANRRRFGKTNYRTGRREKP